MRSNVHCTNCSREFIATLDLSLNGNHVIVCPHCQHEHYRVVRDGEVTEDRWRSSAQVYFAVISTTVTFDASYTTSNMTANWLNRSDLNLT